MSPLWLLRMAKWARHPPSWARVLLVVTVVAMCLALVLVERVVGWPDWLTVNGNFRAQP